MTNHNKTVKTAKTHKQHNLNCHSVKTWKPEVHQLTKSFQLTYLVPDIRFEM